MGIQALPTEESFEQLIFSVQAWVCYPNTVAGGADVSLVVPSMQSDQFASYDWATSGTPESEAPAVHNNMNYHTGMDSYGNPSPRGRPGKRISWIKASMEVIAASSRIPPGSSITAGRRPERRWGNRSSRTASFS